MCWRCGEPTLDLAYQKGCRPLDIKPRTRTASRSLTDSSTGTRSATLYTLNTAAAILASTHPPQRTNTVLRFGRTKAHVSSLTAPLGIHCLHLRHLARPVGAVLIRCVLGRVRKLMRRRVHAHRPHRSFYAAGCTAAAVLLDEAPAELWKRAANAAATVTAA